jgi:DNA invertase Pin-like site-specific DNA recombinase
MWLYFSIHVRTFSLTPSMVASTRAGALQMASSGKFVAYYRVSTDRQGRSGLGLEAQRSAVAAYLNGGNWSIVAEFTEVESGRKAERPELDKALAAARLHRCPLVVSKVDRLTRSVAFLSRLLEANVDVRFADLPQIEGATGRFLLQQMVAVAELEAGMISARTRAALAAAKARGKTLGGPRIRSKDGKPVVISRAAQKRGANANRMRAVDRAADLAPTINQIRADGATTLAAIADGLNAASIPTPRGLGRWSPTQVQRTLKALEEAQGPA